jgi:hypothetical protein
MDHKSVETSLVRNMRRYWRNSLGLQISPRSQESMRLSTAFVGVPTTLTKTALDSRCSFVRAPAESGCTHTASERHISRFKNTREETYHTFAHFASQTLQVSKSS